MRCRGEVVAMLSAVLALSGCGEAPDAAAPSPAPEAVPTPLPEETEVVPDPPAQEEPTDPAVDPAADVVTEEDDGRRVGLAVGEEVALRLSNEWTWEEPRLDGTAVVLSRVDYLVDPGFVEWVVTAQEPGVVELTADGAPDCPDEEGCPPMTLELTFEVGS